VPSPNGKYLAMLTLIGSLVVVSQDFGTRLADFDTTVLVGAEDGGGFVRQVAWCGNDAVFVVCKVEWEFWLDQAETLFCESLLSLM
jgi:Vps16, N-terminal region